MKITGRTFLLLGAFAALIIASCAPMPPAPEPLPEPEVPAPAGVFSVNHQTFSSEIIQYSGPAIVVFYNSSFWQSMDMLQRIEKLASQFEGRAKFAKFHWNVNEDPSRFRLEMLPTVILYRNGYEIDRIKGIPPEESVRRTWNDDLELWFLVNALQVRGGQYSGDYSYLFKNDYTLKVGN